MLDVILKTNDELHNLTGKITSSEPNAANMFVVFVVMPNGKTDVFDVNVSDVEIVEKEIGV